MLTPEFLFKSGNYKRLREQLINEDLIDTIVSIPGGILPHTGMPSIVLVINKNKNEVGKVRFIQTNDFVRAKDTSKKLLNDLELNRVINADNQNIDVVRIIDNNYIKELDYNLSVPRYFKKKIEGVKLRDILTYLSGTKHEVPENFKHIRIRDLSDDLLHYKLDIDKIDGDDKPIKNSRLIDESSLLIASRWKSLKPTYFKYTGIPILIDNGLASLK